LSEVIISERTHFNLQESSMAMIQKILNLQEFSLDKRHPLKIFLVYTTAINISIKLLTEKEAE